MNIEGVRNIADGASVVAGIFFQRLLDNEVSFFVVYFDVSTELIYLRDIYLDFLDFAVFRLFQLRPKSKQSSMLSFESFSKSKSYQTIGFVSPTALQFNTSGFPILNTFTGLPSSSYVGVSVPG